MKLAFCGLGLMGSVMVKKLLEAGHEVNVWNRSSAKAEVLAALGARVCTSPQEAATDVDGVILCLLDAPAVESVVFGPGGIIESSTKTWLVDHSSIAPDHTRAFAQRFEHEAGRYWVDAPVSGGVAGTAAGTLAIMAGGNPNVLNATLPALQAYAARITHLGPSGAGQAAKLCNQAIVASTLNAIAEALSLARAAGIDASKLPEALQGGWADSKLLALFTPRMLEAQEQIIGTLDTMLKDLNGTLALAIQTGTPTSLISTVQQNLLQASAQGLGKAEISALVCLSHPMSTPNFKAQKQGG